MPTVAELTLSTDVAADDKLIFLDISDTTYGSDGTEKIAEATQLLGARAFGKVTYPIAAYGWFTATTNGADQQQVEFTAQQPEAWVYDFDGSSKEYIQAYWDPPKAWDEGTITYQVKWLSHSADTDGVVWAMQAAAISDADAFTTAFGTAVEVLDHAPNDTDALNWSTESAAVTVGGTPAEGDTVVLQLYRNPDSASDVNAEDARFLGIKLYFSVNALNDE